MLVREESSTVALDILTAVSESSSRSASWDIVGVGACAVDRVYILPVSPAGSAADLKVRIRRHFLSAGGQVATMLAAAAGMGARTAYVGTTGSDEHGGFMRDALVRAGIDATHVLTHDAPQAHAAILIDERTGERIVLWDRDERLRLAPADVPRDAIARARLVHVDDVDLDASVAAARFATAAGIPSTSDIERAADRVDELIGSVTCPIFAASAMAELTGVSDPERALRKLRALNPGVLCVTLGTSGAMALDGDAIVHVPAFKVAAVDTTGAGDVFRAGFALAWLEGRATSDVLRFANAAAAVSCTRLGAMSGAPGRIEVDRLLTA